MIEFSFAVTLKFRDGWAFMEEDLEKAHDRFADYIKEALAGELNSGNDIIIDVEPV